MMTLMQINDPTVDPSVDRVLITMADYEEIFEKEHSNKFYDLFTDKLEMFLKRDTVDDIIRKYGLYRSVCSIVHRGFSVFDIFDPSRYGETGWIIRKNNVTPENICLQKAKELLSSFGSQIRNSPAPDINVAKQALDSIEAKVNKSNEDFDYSSCYNGSLTLSEDIYGNPVVTKRHYILEKEHDSVEPDFVRYAFINDSMLKGNEKSMRHTSFLYPKKVIFNGPATIVFWKDGTKTVVKCSENDKANPYNGFCAALAKKIFGNNSKVQKIVKSAEYQVPKECEDSCPIFETEGSVK